MNFFEQQLRQFTINTTALKGYPFTFAGRAAFLPLSGNRKARVEFVTGNIAHEYDTLQISIVDATSGKIDQLKLHLSDYCKHRKGGCSGTYFPHIWYYRIYEWYGGMPDSSEIEAVAKAIHDYIQVFA